jgi:hypothetical protein
MPTSTRPVAMPMIRFLIGLGSAAVLLVHSGPAFGLESPALHAPPAGYQQLGACISRLGRPYRQSAPQADGPIQLLFYTASGLTTVLYLLEEKPFRDGQSLTLLNDLGGLPVTYVLLQYSPGSPFPNGSPLHSQFLGPYYQLWITIDLGPMGTLAPC